MSLRLTSSVRPIAIAVSLTLTTVIVTTQDRSGAATQWTGRTPDGQPDLQGVWTNFDSTPFEARDTRTLSEFDGLGLLYPGINTPAGTSRNQPNPSPDFGEIPAKRSVPRRSLVIEPPDGKAPVLPQALARRDDALRHWSDSWDYHTAWERCITQGGVPATMFASYNTGVLILQTPGAVTFLYEMIGDVRVIPVDGRLQLPSRIRQWNGASRGRWEGNTLVVEVINHNGQSDLGAHSLTGRLRGIRLSEATRVVERFTRIDEDRIKYEATIDDPETFTKPWTIATFLNRDPGYRIYEYACHEGNYGLPNTLRAGRATEGLQVPRK